MTHEKSGAVFSDCKKYRYELHRIWDDSKPFVFFLLHNPSTADEEKDDATIRRCISFAKRWGYGGIYVGNICPYRATNPKDLIGLQIPLHVMQQNDNSIKDMIIKCESSVAAYGNPILMKYVPYDLGFTHWECFGITKKKNPRHPLYLPQNQHLERYAT